MLSTNQGYFGRSYFVSQQVSITSVILDVFLIISSIFTKLFRCLQIHLKSINAYLIIHRVQILIKSKNEIAFYTYLCSILIIQIKMTYILHLLFDLKLVIFCFTFVATIFLLELTDSIREDINEEKLNILFLIYVQLLNR